MMLADWQDALVDALTTSPNEATAVLTAAPGFRLTRRVQREWRSFRIRSSLPLACRLLGTGCDAEIEQYLNAVSEPSSFFLREAEQFAAHVGGCPAGRDEHVAAVVRFELAMLRAVQERARGDSSRQAGRPRPNDVVDVHPAADLIPFAAPPEQVLAAAVAGARPPHRPGRHLLLCTPTVCRVATAVEGAIFDVLRATSQRASVFPPRALESLADAGAIVVVPIGRN